MKKNLIYAAASAIIMLLLPWCAVSFVPNDGGMMVSILLLFAVNPISAVCIGIVSGRNPKSSWFQPLLLSILFAIGAWGFLDLPSLIFSCMAQLIWPWDTLPCFSPLSCAGKRIPILHCNSAPQVKLHQTKRKPDLPKQVG